MAVFLAPHYDDVALSCGGMVAALADGGTRPLVVTVFGGEPGGELTGFARWQHQRWGTAGTDTLTIRRAEEGAAAGILGCETRWLAHLDAIYRGDRYLSDEALFGPLVPDEAPLVERIAAEVLALPELARAPDGAATLYVPLAAGGHVDHQIVYAVGRAVARRGGGAIRRVLAYEDYPYAALDDHLTRRLAAVAGDLGEAELAPIAGTLARRIAAIAAYRSQLPVIFRFTADWPAAVGDYARRTGAGRGPAERYWPLTATA